MARSGAGLPAKSRARCPDRSPRDPVSVLRPRVLGTRTGRGTGDERDRDVRRRACAGAGGPWRSPLEPGSSFGVAFLLRPEMAWALIAVLVASTTLDSAAEVQPKPGTTSDRRLLLGLTVAGAAIALAPLEIYTLAHFHRIMPSHSVCECRTDSRQLDCRAPSPGKDMAASFRLDAFRADTPRELLGGGTARSARFCAHSDRRFATRTSFPGRGRRTDDFDDSVDGPQ